MALTFSALWTDTFYAAFQTAETGNGVLCFSDGSVSEPDMAANFCPDHKAPMVLFLDRVYGIKDQTFLLHLLEVGFLPDLRASASLDTVSS